MLFQRGILAMSVAAVLAAPGAVSASQNDGVSLTVTLGPAPGEIRLDWTGGAPVFRVYRSAGPQAVVSIPNAIGSTSALAWSDTPPAGSLFFYIVTPPCTNIPYCDAGEYCDASGVCAAAQPDGSSCSGDNACSSSHCSNGYCCAAGNCCASSADCGAFSAPAGCDTAATCEGTRADGVCNALSQCDTILADDDSGCSGLESQQCGEYPSVFCTAAPVQPGNQAALCQVSCTGDPGCDPAAHCDGSTCLPDLAAGGTCDAPGDCLPGLFCTDAVCCTTECAGVCQGCNLPISPGSCGLVPNGQDPSSECGAVSCTGYYFGFSGDFCLRKADVGAPQAACSGSGACLSAAQECGAQSIPGPVTSTCHDVCQDPTPGTCTGTIAGTCTDLINPGTQTCGVGDCLRTTNICQNGAPVTCTPGAPATEICNNRDDNCDGIFDNGAFSDSLEPNGSCGSARVLASVGSDQTKTYSNMTVYALGDTDYYAIPAIETDSSCGCGIFSFDEDYDMRVAVTAPVGSGSYEVCMNTNTCTFPTGYCFEVVAGNTLNLQQYLDGSCVQGSTDSYTVFVSVRGLDPPGFECLPYTLTYTFDAGLCR